MVTIGDSQAGLEQSLADVLHEILPQTVGYAVKVEILEKDRKKRSDASRLSWRPGQGEIRITFPSGANLAPTNPSQTNQQHLDPSVLHPSMSQRQAGMTPQWADVIQSLQSAEQRPGFDFVSLKWFRDLFLPAEEHGWANSSAARDEVIRSAIERGIILINKVPNPKNPAFPVTAIRLNRGHPEVVAALGDNSGAFSAFEPIDIAGEALSDTILGERR